jgi:hypothetical protein
MDVHPRVEQWSNGVDQSAELTRLMGMRNAAMDRAGERLIPTGTSMAQIEEVLVPLYLHHRYAAQATATMIAGQDFIYAFRGDGRTPTKWVPAADQKKAIDALMTTLSPSALALPKGLLGLIPPRPDGINRTREMFPRYTGPVFDALTPAFVAGDMTMGFILTNDRAARMVEQKAVDPSLPGLEDVTDRLIATVYDTPASNSYQAEISRGLQRILAGHLMELAATSPMSQVRAIATYKLKALQAKLKLRDSATSAVAERAHASTLASDIARFLEHPSDASLRIPPMLAAPPGAPIGDLAMDYLLGLDPSCGWIR